MADSGPASFLTQANALLRKNLVFQRRNVWTNVRLVSIPFVLCILLVVMQMLFETQFNDVYGQCGCTCNDSDGDGKCEKRCGFRYSTSVQAAFCAIPKPPQWPPLLQIPSPRYRAVMTDSSPMVDLPSELCRRTGSCPATVLLTGNNHSLGQILSDKMYSSSSFQSSDITGSLSSYVLGSSSLPAYTNYLDSGVISDSPIYDIQRQCAPNSSFSVLFQDSSLSFPKGLYLWRNTSSDVNDELYKGYRKGNPEEKINEYTAAFDFQNTDMNNLNVNVWYNTTYKNDTGGRPIVLIRVPRLVNLASNAYLEFLRGAETKILLEFVKEMPKPETKLSLDIASLVGPLFFTWVILLLFPVILTTLVYEKQQRLRIMMKMHGLGDGPYWIISYAYFLVVSMLYMICFAVFGSVIGLNFFRLNDYSIQFVFFSISINLQISIAFLASAMFSNVKTATVISYICVFATGLLGFFLFQFFLEDTLFPRSWIIVMEIYPGFSLYRGLYELSQFAFSGNYRGVDGMRWRDFATSMEEVITIMLVEWLLVLVFAYYIDQITYSAKHPLFFLQNFQKKHHPSLRNPDPKRQASRDKLVEMEKPDVRQERERVEELLLESTEKYAVVCNNIRKVYREKDGNPPKFAVRGLSLALPQGECFGMLGPNGAGKTSFINMMTGIINPSSGTAFVQGLGILTDMDRIYTSIGVCPQHDLLWETLTGKEHLLFYGRLKNLKGLALTQAVEESLRSVNLYHGGVSEKQVGKYSGGMKRRLSVAISLIGNPKVVYMDEPSTGLDPASRKSLWDVVKLAKNKGAIILTTHSMEEAEVLCDRIGVFVDGSLQCIGNPKELKGRYGGSYVFTMTASPEHEREVEKLVYEDLSGNAKKIYQISGTQKFELPKQEVKMADVFQAVEKAKNRFPVFAWGISDTTLEDVFVKVAHSSQPFNV
ncbi:PREDICTED: ABC transporter A family member 8 isoform X2 [Tarenaya hassleriana]|uniref:ABC transporter A family member 8 isoform X2 n=1 Tax=Tarenaya hassleriana TaxID=28532 RepID=UPI00053C2939|nr:PREDICTED: ABC transporter A family member 8 isoform X2 [Tarenaya hassleriana]